MGANSLSSSDAGLDLDEQIAQLMQCKPLSEQQVRLRFVPFRFLPPAFRCGSFRVVSASEDADGGVGWDFGRDLGFQRMRRLILACICFVAGLGAILRWVFVGYCAELQVDELRISLWIGEVSVAGGSVFFFFFLAGEVYRRETGPLT